MAQFLRPDTDVSDGAWLPSTGADLYATIDESVASDTDYNYTLSASAFTVELSSGTDPAVATGHIVRYRAAGNGVLNLEVSLIEGASTVRATWTEIAAAAAWTDYSHTLSAGEANSITNYADLRLKFEMASLVYGPEAFTVGTTVALETHDADWAKLKANGLSVNESLDKVIAAAESIVTPHRWTGTTLVGQMIKADIKAVTSHYPNLLARCDSAGNCYVASWDASAGVIDIQRATDDFGTFTSLATGGTVSNGVTYTGAYLKVTGINPCVLEAGDDTNGAAAVTFSDSVAGRYQSGQPGLDIYTPDITPATTASFDNVEIHSA